MACICGVETDRLIRGDPLEAELWGRVTQRAGDLTTRMMKDQAVHNANAIAEVLRQMFRR